MIYEQAKKPGVPTQQTVKYQFKPGFKWLIEGFG